MTIFPSQARLALSLQLSNDDVSAPSPAEAELQLAIELHRNGQLAEARVHYAQALQLDPHHARAVRLLGGLYLQLGEAASAETLLAQAVSWNDDDCLLHFLLGTARSAVGRFTDAVESYDRAIALQPDFADAQYNRGNALLELNQVEAALAGFDRVLAFDDRNPMALNNRGIALARLGDQASAIRCYDKALAVKPDFVDGHFNRANAERELRQHEAAVAGYQRVLSLDPNHVRAYINLGSTLIDLQRHRAAIETYDRLLALHPGLAQAHSNRGVASYKLGQFSDAIADLTQAIALDPDGADHYYNRGLALLESKRLEDAVADFDRAQRLGSTTPGLWGMLLTTQMQICDWRGLEERVAALQRAVLRGEPAANPFQVLALLDSPDLQRRNAEAWVRKHHAPESPLTPIGLPAPREKIRIGYFSPDFREHPVSILAAELFELHDRSAFELIGFGLGPPTRDTIRARLERTFDRFVDLHATPPRDGAVLARSLGLDIAVDLGPHTLHSQPQLFALRVAPVQISYLGFAGTTGAPYMDYLIADRTVIPPRSRGGYLERILQLPGSVLPNDSQREIDERTPSREKLGLPPEGFVFCCFNAWYKLNPAVFDRWMRILSRVEGSVLWLSSGAPPGMRNLRVEAEARGIAGERLIFAQRIASAAQHLARHRAADLFLDTLPFNAHSTAIDALWAGLPVLTVAGEAFAARVGASLLEGVGLPELSVETAAAYEDLAVDLAQDRGRLAQLRQRLAALSRTAALFDTQGYVRHLEAAFKTVHARARSLAPAADLVVEAQVPTRW